MVAVVVGSVPEAAERDALRPAVACRGCAFTCDVSVEYLLNNECMPNIHITVAMHSLIALLTPILFERLKNRGHQVHKPTSSYLRSMNMELGLPIDGSYLEESGPFVQIQIQA